MSVLIWHDFRHFIEAFRSPWLFSIWIAWILLALLCKPRGPNPIRALNGHNLEYCSGLRCGFGRPSQLLEITWMPVPHSVVSTHSLHDCPRNYPAAKIVIRPPALRGWPAANAKAWPCWKPGCPWFSKTQVSEIQWSSASTSKTAAIAPTLIFARPSILFDWGGSRRKWRPYDCFVRW